MTGLTVGATYKDVGITQYYGDGPCPRIDDFGFDVSFLGVDVIGFHYMTYYEQTYPEGGFGSSYTMKLIFMDDLVGVNQHHFDANPGFSLLPIWITRGDANKDGNINFSDVNYTASVVDWYSGSGTGRPTAGADPNYDGIIDYKDVGWYYDQSSFGGNGNKCIDIAEAFNAINDYHASKISYSAAIYVIDGYYDHGALYSPLLDLPEVYTLSQNYPNPFNPKTTINYELPKSGDISLKIYNAAGQLVRTLVNEHNEAGNYSVEWNGEDDTGNTVPTGMYIYRMTNGENIVDTKKMLLVK